MGLVKLNDRGVRSATAFGSVSGGGSFTFIKKVTASSSATLDFVDGTSDVVLDSTYKEYMFTFKDIHPATDLTNFLFQVDTGTNTSYNQTVTNSFFQAYHNEAGTATGQMDEYLSSHDEAQTTNFIDFSHYIGNGNDECIAGTLHLFNPSSGTFVKHFMSRMNSYNGNDYTSDYYNAGYFNTTTALTRVQFKMTDGDIDAGTIKLYGVT